LRQEEARAARLLQDIRARQAVLRTSLLAELERLRQEKELTVRLAEEQKSLADACALSVSSLTRSDHEYTRTPLTIDASSGVTKRLASFHLGTAPTHRQAPPGQTTIRAALLPTLLLSRGLSFSPTHRSRSRSSPPLRQRPPSVIGDNPTSSFGTDDGRASRSDTPALHPGGSLVPLPTNSHHQPLPFPACGQLDAYRGPQTTHPPASTTSTTPLIGCPSRLLVRLYNNGLMFSVVRIALSPEKKCLPVCNLCRVP